MDTKDKSTIGEARASVGGPKGSSIPIIANSVVANIPDFIKNNGYNAFEKALDQFIECGFNGFIGQVNYDDRDMLPEILNRVQNKGLFMMLGSDAFRRPKQSTINNWLDVSVSNCKDKFNDRIEETILKCKHQPALGGIALKDEPTHKQLKTIYEEPLTLSDVNTEESAYYCPPNCYRLVKDILQKNKMQDVIVFENLIGLRVGSFLNDDYSNLEKPITLAAKYGSYLDAYGKMMGNPYLWSYDIYPVEEINYLLQTNYQALTGTIPAAISKNGDISVQYEYFYQDLEFFHARTNTPTSVFWTYVQGMTHFVSQCLRPLALEQYLRFAVFSSLAMGSQGIIYWTYHQRDNEEKELYLSAPIDREEKKTAIWYSTPAASCSPCRLGA